jgi:hypothetical protein
MSDKPAAKPPKESGLSTRRFRNPREALGHAVALLRQTEPFASYKFGRFAASLGGHIRRGHYFFTFEDGRMVGDVGWARCTEAVAEDWVTGGTQMPRDQRQLQSLHPARIHRRTPVQKPLRLQPHRDGGRKNRIAAPFPQSWFRVIRRSAPRIRARSSAG